MGTLGGCSGQRDGSPVEKIDTDMGFPSADQTTQANRWLQSGDAYPTTVIGSPALVAWSSHRLERVQGWVVCKMR